MTVKPSDVADTSVIPMSVLTTWTVVQGNQLLIYMGRGKNTAIAILYNTGIIDTPVFTLYNVCVFEQSNLVGNSQLAVTDPNQSVNVVSGTSTIVNESGATQQINISMDDIRKGIDFAKQYMDLYKSFNGGKEFGGKEFGGKEFGGSTGSPAEDFNQYMLKTQLVPPVYPIQCNCGSSCSKCDSSGTNAVSAATGVTTGTGAAATAATGAGTTAATGAGTTATGTGAAATTTGTNGRYNVLQDAGQLARDASSGVGKIVSDVGGEVGDLARDAGSGVGSLVRDTGSGVTGLVKDIGGGVGGFVKDVGSGVGGFVKDIGSGVGGFVKDVGSGTLNLGREIVGDRDYNNNYNNNNNNNNNNGYPRNNSRSAYPSNKAQVYGVDTNNAYGAVPEKPGNYRPMPASLSAFGR